MSKLDGNERWGSKFILEEHKEKYDKRNETPAKGIPTEEELYLVRDHILLPHMLTMVDNSIDEIKHSNNILNRLFMDAAFVLRDLIDKDRRTIKKELFKRNIRVELHEQVDFIVHHKIFCRGYEDKFPMTREVMRTQIRLQLTEYIRKISQLLKGGTSK